MRNALRPGRLASGFAVVAVLFATAASASPPGELQGHMVTLQLPWHTDVVGRGLDPEDPQRSLRQQQQEHLSSQRVAKTESPQDGKPVNPTRLISSDSTAQALSCPPPAACLPTLNTGAAPRRMLKGGVILCALDQVRAGRLLLLSHR